MINGLECHLPLLPWAIPFFRSLVNWSVRGARSPLHILLILGILSTCELLAVHLHIGEGRR
jgi:hypothetical protein